MPYSRWRRHTSRNEPSRTVAAAHSRLRQVSADDRLDTQAVDVVLLGTFSAWKLGTLQARALPQAAALQAAGLRCALLTVPWDQPSERGVHDSISGLPVLTTRAINPAMPLPALQEIDARLRQWRPRALHICKPRGFGGLAALRSLAQRRASGQRPLLLVDADDWEGDGGWNRVGNYGPLQRRVLHWQEETLLRRADAVTAASRIMQHRAAALRGIAPDAVTYLPNGLTEAWATMLAPPDTAQQARALRRERGNGLPLQVLLYSRFEEIGPDWINVLAGACAARGVRAEFTVLGESATSHDWGGRKSVRLMGYVARSTIPTHLQTCDVALLPIQDSLVGRAKNSVKLLELMAAGCVTLASAVGDVPETLANAGIAVPGSDPEAFAAAIARVADQPNHMRELSAMAVEHVRARYRYPNVALPLVTTYMARGIVRA